MAGLSLLSPRNKAGVGAGPGTLETGLGSTAASQSYAAMLNTPYTGQFVASDQYINERDALVEKRLGKSLSDYSGTSSIFTSPTAEGRIQQKKQDRDFLDKQIEIGRKENPGLWDGIKTTAEIEQEAKQNVSASERAAASIAERNPSAISRATGTFLGSVSGTMVDLPNLATMTVGAPAGFLRTAGMSAARRIALTAAAEGALQSGIQAAQIPEMKSWQEKLGNQYGLSEAALDVGAAFIGGAAIRGTADAIGHGFRLATETPEVPPSTTILGEMAKFSPRGTIQDSLKYMERMAYIDESTVLPIARNADLKAHRDNVQKVVNDIQDYKRPSADISLRESPRASGENTSPAYASGAGTQDLPSQRSIRPSPFDMANTLPSNRYAVSKDLASIDSTSNSIVYHKTSNINKLLATADQLKGDLEGFLQEVSDGVDSLKFYGVRVKDKADLIDKTKRKGRKADTMSDVLGGRVVADTPEAIREAVKAISARARVIEVDDKLGEALGKYKAVHMIVESDKGVAAEIQIQPREIREVQDIAHEKYYKKWRNRLPESLTQQEIDEFEADVRAQAELFADAWRRWEQRTGTGTAPFDENAYRLSEYREPAPAIIEEIKPTDQMEITRSSFDDLVKQDPDFEIVLEDGTIAKLADIAERVKQDEKIIEALTTCRLS